MHLRAHEERRHCPAKPFLTYIIPPITAEQTCNSSLADLPAQEFDERVSSHSTENAEHSNRARCNMRKSLRMIVPGKESDRLVHQCVAARSSLAFSKTRKISEKCGDACPEEDDT